MIFVVPAESGDWSAFGQDGHLAELKAQSRRHEQSTTDAV